MKYLIIILVSFLPLTVSAQLLRSYGVVEIGSTFPTSTVTGAKFAYRTVDSSFYRWTSGNTWVKIVEPSIVPDTLYLTESIGTSYKVSGDTINLTPYLLKSDTTAMLVKYIERGDTAGMMSAYIRSAGWGLLKTSHTLTVDSSKVASRYYVSTSPTTIAANYAAVSNGTNLIARNLFDNNTYAGVIGRPWKFGEWVTAGRPTGVNGYTGFNTSFNWLDIYSSTGWFSPARAATTGGAFTSAYVPFGGIGGLTESPNLSFTNSARLKVTGTAITGTTQITPTTSSSAIEISMSTNGGFEGGALLFGSQFGTGAAIRYSHEGGSGNTIGGLGFYTRILPASAFMTRSFYIEANGNATFEKDITALGALSAGRFAFRTSATYGTLDEGINSNGTYRNTQYATQINYSNASEGGVDFKTAPLMAANSAMTLTSRMYLNQIGRLRLGGVASASYQLDVQGTDAIGFPRGTVAQRPIIVSNTTPFRYNTDSTALEYGESVGAWRQLATRTYARSLVSGLPTTWLKTELEAGRDVTINGTSASDFTLNHVRVKMDDTLTVGDSILHTTFTSPYRFLFSKAAIRLGNRGDNLSTIDFWTGNNFTVASDWAVVNTGDRLDFLANGGTVAAFRLYDNQDFVFEKFRYQSGIMQFTPVTGTTMTKELRLTEYGTGTKEAADLSKTQSNYIAGFATDGTVLDYSLSNLPNGIYTGSGTLASYTTRATIPSTGNLLFSQTYNSNADSAYIQVINNLDGNREVRLGLTDTVTTGYANLRLFQDEPNESMGFEFRTEDSYGGTTLKGENGGLSMYADNTLEMRGTEIRLNNGEVLMNQYGQGNMKSTDLGVSDSKYVAKFSTNGRVTDYYLARDTFIEDVTLFSVGTLMYDCQELTIVSSMTALASTYQEIRFPDAADHLRGKKIIVYSKKRDGGTYVPYISVVGGVSRLYYTTNPAVGGTDPSSQATLYIDDGTWSDHGATYEFTCLKIDNTPSYRWVLKQR